MAPRARRGGAHRPISKTAREAVATNIEDYLRWRGDLTLAERPFNEVDNLVLATLSYVDLRGLVPGPGLGSTTVADAARLLTGTEPAAAQLQRSPDAAERLTVATDDFLLLVAGTARFGDAVLSSFVDTVGQEPGTQFSAVTCELPDGTGYVAFRGTDNTILGWREDFEMSFEVMPAQRLARDYLSAAIGRLDRPVRVGGHSKGGNLALYAAMTIKPGEQDRLISIHSNDGPGLTPESRDQAALARLADRIHKLVPAFAVVGMLFEDGEPPIVASSAEGLMQHDPLSWQVVGDRLVRVPAIAPRAALLNAGLVSWLGEADLADRRAFTSAFFDALTANARTTLNVAALDYDAFEDVLIAFAQTRRQARRPVRLMTRAVVRTIRETDLTASWRKGGVRAAVFVVLGVILVAVPAFAVQVLGAVAVLALAVWGTWRLVAFLRRFHRALGRVWPWLLVAVAILAGLMVLASQLRWLIVPANLLLGIAFLVNTWTNANRALQFFYAQPRRILRGVLVSASAVLSFLFGVVALSTADRVAPFFVRQAGSYLLLAGLIELFLLTRDKTARRLRDAYAAEVLDPRA